jgi:hypothetical protein
MVVGDLFEKMHIRPGEVGVVDDKVGNKMGFLMIGRI